ncbi:MAG: hypothetical protein GXP16_01515 [Gammaproteobacteria bacterium]|nr:hypothetical protein [Gammaproteobacteria bacterium]
MGQAFDESGDLLGEAIGKTKREVFDKLMAEHGEEANELRIRKLQESVKEIEGKFDTEAREIVRKIDEKLGSGWAKELAEALGYAP